MGTTLQRAGTAALAATALVAACLTAAAPPASALTALDIPADIPAEMTAVAANRFQPAITADTRLLAADTATLGADRTHQAADEELVTEATTALTRATAEVAADTAALTAATAASSAAATAVVDDHRRLGAIALELYTDPVSAGGGPGLAGAQRQATAQALLGVVTDGQRRQLAADVTTAATDRKAVAAATTALAGAQAALATATHLHDDRTAILAADGRAVTAAEAAVAGDTNALVGDQSAQGAAVAAVAQPPGAPADGSPTILGGAALDAAQIVAWYEGRGEVDRTSTPIAQLVTWYLQEGAAEGVRGDVAFAQAMVETAGFSSDDAVTFNNYAGIGHCDACATGSGFPSAQAGVRGQIQLLRAFATPGLTSAMLAAPPVSPAVVPESDPVRGCCVSFQALTGRWASDPLYGHTVMTMYQSMLASALTGPPST
ncbi:MAG TPA: glucosaminidase domain-containing protein [Acidimicrobiales bacterium]|nr:glucosaminidase domain-containing protein [Acidimicrobiales bacterium]